MFRCFLFALSLLLGLLASSCASDKTDGSTGTPSFDPDVRQSSNSEGDPEDAAQPDLQADSQPDQTPEPEDVGESDTGADTGLTPEAGESDLGLDSTIAEEPEDEPLPLSCTVHEDCGGSGLCSEGVCLDPFQIEVATADDWTVDPYTTLIEFCPDAPEELREVNPVVSPGFPRDVETPDGPGVQSQAEGTTEWCCGCTLTFRRFELPTLETEGVFLSFWFDSGFIGEPGPWNQPTLGILLLNGDEEVGSIRFSQFAGRYSNCPYEDVYEPAKEQRIRLDELYDGLIDAIVLEMGHYACVGTNFVTVGPLRVTR